MSPRPIAVPDRPLRVAHVIHSLGGGGAEGLLVEIARGAAAAGLEIVVIGLSDAEDDRVAAQLVRAGARVHQLHAGRYDVTAVVRVARLLRRERVDVVHTHLKHADLVGGVAARLVGLASVSTLHVIEAQPTSLAAKLRVRLAVSARSLLAQRVIALSQAQRRWYAALGGARRLIVIPNGVREPLPKRTRDEVRAELDVPDGVPLLLTLSLMRPEKGHEVYLDALADLPADVEYVAALAGDGPLLEAIRARVAAEPALARRVRVLGFRRDADDLLQAADVVVHPSLADALPTALISAIAAGRPVLATQVGGIPDIVQEAAGVLVPPGDSRALKEGIMTVLGDKSAWAEMGVAARAHYESTYTANGWLTALRRTYEAVRDGETALDPTTAVRTAVILSAVRPFPADNGKSIVIGGMLEHLVRRLGAGNVHFVHVGAPLSEDFGLDGVVVHEVGAPSRLEQVTALGRDVLFGKLSMQEAFLASPTVTGRIADIFHSIDPDLEIIDTLRLEQHVRHLPHRGRRVLYLDDLFSVRYRRMLAVMDDTVAGADFNPLGNFATHVPAMLRPLAEGGPTRRLLLRSEATRIARSERAAALRASTSLLLNDEEAESLARTTGASVELIPPGLPGPQPNIGRWNGAPEYVFVGLLSIAHNHDGLMAFLRDGMPELLRIQPEARLHVVGRGASDALLDLASTFGDRVVMHGFVPDLDDLLGPACALVNPLRFGSGVKIKVIESIARGLPVVATPVGAEGVAVTGRPGLTVVDDMRAMARALARLANPAVRQSESAGALEIYREKFAPEVIAGRYDEVLGTTPPVRPARPRHLSVVGE